VLLTCSQIDRALVVKSANSSQSRSNVTERTDVCVICLSRVRTESLVKRCTEVVEGDLTFGNHLSNSFFSNAELLGKNCCRVHSSSFESTEVVTHNSRLNRNLSEDTRDVLVR